MLRLSLYSKIRIVVGIGALAADVAALDAVGPGIIYEGQCISENVPTPPPFAYQDAVLGLPGGWLPAGELDVIFAGSDGLVTEVYYAPTSDGVCMALPRFTATPVIGIEFLGIVCQGKSSSKACFWDLKTGPGQGFPIDHVVCAPSDNQNPTVACDSPWEGGTDLPDNDICTACHAGENAFVVHPNTALQLGANLDLLLADNWVDPIVPSTWPQNPGPANYYLDSSATCNTCHDQEVGVPNVNPFAGRLAEYSEDLGKGCTRVLGNALLNPELTTMPGYAYAEAVFQACRMEEGVAPWSRAVHHLAGLPNPTVFEASHVAKLKSASIPYGDIQRMYARPYVSALPPAPVPQGITIDGQLDAAWLQWSVALPIDVPIHGGRRNEPTIDQIKQVVDALADPSDLFRQTDDFWPVSGLVDNFDTMNISASYRALWDSNNLYLYVDVVDNSRFGDSGSDVYKDDSVEIFLDSRNEKSSNFDDNDYHFMVRPGDPTIHVGHSSDPPLTPLTYAWSNHINDAGYVVEIAIPWSAVGRTPGGQIGLELHVNDDDDGGDREGQTGWRTSSSTTYLDPSTFTTVDLPIPIVEGASGGPVIDGYASEMDWSLVPLLPISRTPLPISASNNSATWSTFWDEEALYLFVNVVDSEVSLPHDSADAYHDDSIEIFIDGNNSHGGSYDGHDDFQFIFKAGESNRLFWGDRSLNAGDEFDFASMSRITDDGYTLELALSWKALKTAPADLRTFGIEVQVNDDDDGDNREGKLAWCSDSNDTYLDTRRFCVGQLHAFSDPAPALARAPRNNVRFAGDIDGVLTLDGNPGDPLWQGIAPFAVVSPIEGTPSMTLSRSWRGAWNEEFLYLQVSVEDSGMPVADSANWYNDDSVEVYLSPGRSRLDYYREGDVQYIFRPNESDLDPNSDIVQLGYHSQDASVAGVQVRTEVRQDGSGYDMEIAIPWRNLGVLPLPTARLGFELQINNDNPGSGGDRDSKVAWFATPFIGDVAFERPDVFAPISLGD